MGSPRRHIAMEELDFENGEDEVAGNYNRKKFLNNLQRMKI
jgi:hypothetical protein